MDVQGVRFRGHSEIAQLALAGGGNKDALCHGMSVTVRGRSSAPRRVIAAQTGSPGTFDKDIPSFIRLFRPENIFI
jgi:hypothetical protein